MGKSLHELSGMSYQVHEAFSEYIECAQRPRYQQIYFLLIDDIGRHEVNGIPQRSKRQLLLERGLEEFSPETRNLRF